MVGCNGRTWQLGLDNVYRDRCFASREEAMAAYAEGVRKACDLANQWNGQ
jgi:hypothetical protein